MDRKNLIKNQVK